MEYWVCVPVHCATWYSIANWNRFDDSVATTSIRFYICNALNIYDCHSHGKFIDIKTRCVGDNFRSHLFMASLWICRGTKQQQHYPITRTLTKVHNIFLKLNLHATFDTHSIFTNSNQRPIFFGPLYLPELSSVCVWTPWLTFPEPVSGAKPRNFSIVFTASCSVVTADNSYVSSNSTQAENGQSRLITKVNCLMYLKSLFVIFSVMKITQTEKKPV